MTDEERIDIDAAGITWTPITADAITSYIIYADNPKARRHWWQFWRRKPMKPIVVTPNTESDIIGPSDSITITFLTGEDEADG